ncbi:MAG: branched-chain amino acid ABC transporter permease [Chloroflexota bacterium]|nr:branched-chain amino acid ABC transporter permease [Chloroflexota bacterium]
MNMRSIPTWVQALAFFLVVAVVVYVTFSQGLLTEYWQQVILTGAIMTISALGLNLKYGYTGLFALGQAAFYGIGAYSSALVTKDWLTQWSGSPVGGLAGLLGIEAGFVASVVVLSLLKVGKRRRALREWLERLISPFEATVLTTVVTVLVGAAVLGVVGGGVGWLVRRAALLVVPAVLGGLPMAVSQQIIFLVALIAGAVLAALIGFLISLPLLNLTYDYLCIATLGFGIITYVFFNNADVLIPTMKGARGMVAIPRLTTWPWVVGALAVALVVMRNLIYSSTGRAILATRDDLIAADTMGIDTYQHKILAYTIGCAYAGLAGGLYAHLYAFLHPSNFTWLKSVDPFVMVVFGGVGSMTGTILGAFSFVTLLEGLRVLPAEMIDWRYVIYPVILLLVMLFRPQGIMGTGEWGFLKRPKVGEKDVAEEPVSARHVAAPGTQSSLSDE